NRTKKESKELNAPCFFISINYLNCYCIAILLAAKNSLISMSIYSKLLYLKSKLQYKKQQIIQH
ncbi:hypothetical protein QTI47_14985, partial [Clostridium perfringens]|nr:hypothetical protein [Clostridium perfringens]